MDEALCAPIDELYDVVVASAGGYPLDVDLRQAHKPLENACRALKPGGTVLFFAECPDGAGHSRFADYVRTYADDFEMEKALREKFEVGGHKAYWVARLGRLYDVRLVSGLDEEFVRRCHFKAADAGEFQVPPGARVALLPHAGHTLPVLVG